MEEQERQEIIDGIVELIDKKGKRAKDLGLLELNIFIFSILEMGNYLPKWCSDGSIQTELERKVSRWGVNDKHTYLKYKELIECLLNAMRRAEVSKNRLLWGVRMAVSVASSGIIDLNKDKLSEETRHKWIKLQELFGVNNSIEEIYLTVVLPTVKELKTFQLIIDLLTSSFNCKAIQCIKEAYCNSAMRDLTDFVELARDLQDKPSIVPDSTMKLINNVSQSYFMDSANELNPYCYIKKEIRERAKGLLLYNGFEASRYEYAWLLIRNDLNRVTNEAN